MKSLKQLLNLFRRRKLDAEMAEEMRLHVELQTERNIAAGMKPDEARYATLRQFGNLASIQEQARENREWWLGQFFQDVRYAVRMLVKSPRHTAIAVCTLALGIGLVTIQYSVVNGIRRGLPFPESERVVAVFPMDQAGRVRNARLEEVRSWQETQRSFSRLAAFSTATLEISGENLSARSYRGAAFSAGLLELLGVSPIMGRTFTPDDERVGAPPVLLLRQGAWEKDFSADPAIVGRVVRLRGEPATVVGVLPETFGFPENQHAWVNLRPALGPSGNRPGENADARVIGRLRENTTPESARAEFDLLVRQSEVAGTVLALGGVRALVRPVVDPDGGKAGRVALSLLGVVGGVLALACLNVANLLSVRAIQRGSELALRSALGATRGRLVRQLLAESALLALMGAVGGIVLVAGGVPMVNGLFANIPDKPFWFAVEVDYRVLIFSVAVTAVVGVLAGLFPALRATRRTAIDMLKETAGGGGSGGRLGRINHSLVVVQLVLSSALLLVTSVLVDAAWKAGEIGLSFDPRTVLSAQLRLTTPALADAEARARFCDQLLARLRALPWVSAVTLTDRYPLERSGTYKAVELAGDRIGVDIGVTLCDAVVPGFFRDLQIPLREGREFLETDDQRGERVAIVNASFARRAWPGESAVGKRFRYPRNDLESPWITVVGVVADLSSDHTPRTNARIHQPLRQTPSADIVVYLRARGDPHLLARPLEDAVQALSPDVPLDRVTTLAARFEEAGGPVRAFSVLALAFGVAGLFLAVVGAYGVTAFAVQRRTREFGIRIALGAKPSDLLGFVFRQGARQLALGLVLGVGLGWVAGKPARAAVSVIAESTDPISYMLVLGVIAGAVALALWIPARRAAKADPMVALRTE